MIPMFGTTGDIIGRKTSRAVYEKDNEGKDLSDAETEEKSDKPQGISLGINAWELKRFDRIR